MLSNRINAIRRFRSATIRLIPLLTGLSALTTVGCGAGDAEDGNLAVTQRAISLEGERNGLLVIVNPDVYPQIADEIATYRADLAAEGRSTTLEVQEAPNPEALKATILAAYQADDELGGVFLVGDHPLALCEAMPYLGTPADPGVSDYYYMDLDGDWRDQNGDGVYDYLGKGSGPGLDDPTTDRAPEIYVSRLYGSNVELYGPGQEAPLYEAYFQRNHAFRADHQPRERHALYVSDADFYTSVYSEHMERETLVSYPELSVLLIGPGGAGTSFNHQPPRDEHTGVASQMFQQSLAAGLEFVHHGGHGGAQHWGGLVTSPELAQIVLSGGQLPAFVLASTCGSAEIQLDENITSVMVLGRDDTPGGPGRGSMAAFGYSGQTAMSHDWVGALMKGLRWGTTGEALKYMNDYVFGARENWTDLVYTSALIALAGDPTLRTYWVNDADLRVWIKDEGSNNQSTAFALYVENAGSAPVADFKVRYHFARRASDPEIALQDNYTPNSVPRLSAVSPLQRYVELDFAGTTLQPGQVTSWGQGGGEKVRVHFADWALGWDESDDFSATGKSNAWRVTERVDVLSATDERLYGWPR